MDGFRRTVSALVGLDKVRMTDIGAFFKNTT
jgi:hypothetical protein